jgi:pyruvate/2-oxoglutarate dehydrogenase complex dihydrolipoamide dehydrogenase (E3) component
MDHPEVGRTSLAGSETAAVLAYVNCSVDTNGIGLERAGIKLTSSGYVSVKERLETTVPAVWAMGDCAGNPAFTHMAFDDFRIVRDNLRGMQRSTTGRQAPFCLFIEPELARVGLNEIDAKRQGVSYRLTELPISAILRTRTTGETRGKLKALIGEDDRCGRGFPTMQSRSCSSHIPLTQRGWSRFSQTSSHPSNASLMVRQISRMAVHIKRR